MHPAHQPLTAAQLKAEVGALSTQHRLTRGTSEYREGFIDAFVRVYGAKNEARDIAKKKFFIGSSVAYSEDQYIESACELSVANHVALSTATNYEVDKKLGQSAGKKDVDVVYSLGPIKVVIEVKCPREREIPPMIPTLDFAGRHPEADRMFAELRNLISQAANVPAEQRQLQLAQHKDNKLKDFLLLAHGKFPDEADFDRLAVLFVACGEDLGPWHGYLFENQGLFTAASFHPIAEYERTQVVILSNLKYFHAVCAAHHDWTLKNVFMLPCVNPRASPSITGDLMSKGLAILDHHLAPFSAYRPQSAPDVPLYVEDAIRLNHYVHAGLSEADFSRYFPCTQRQGPKAAKPSGTP
jgi:hypothetical protein